MIGVERGVNGFTLIEVIVALAIGSIILVTAHGLLVTLGDGADTIAAAATDSDRYANSDRILRGLVGRLHPGVEEDMFEGQPLRAEFTSWCDTPNGWQERCRVELAVDSSGSVNCLIATQASGSYRHTQVLAAGFSDGVIRYLSDARYGGSWIRIWGASISAPLAIGVILDGDTTLLRIGDRG